MLLIAVTVGTLAAVVAVVAFPVVVPPTAAVVALHAVFIGGMYGHGKERQHKAHRILKHGKDIYVFFLLRMAFMFPVCVIGIKVHVIVFVHSRKYTDHHDEAEQKTHNSSHFQFHQIPSFI